MVVRTKCAGEFGFADLNGMEVSVCKSSLGEQRVRVTCPHLVRVGQAVLLALHGWGGVTSGESHSVTKLAVDTLSALTSGRGLGSVTKVFSKL